MTFNASLAAGDPRAIIDDIENRFGAFMSEPLPTAAGDWLHLLLNAYGVTDSAPHKAVTDKELITLYSTARGSVLAGRIVAQRINAKYGVNPLLDPSGPNTRIHPPVAPIPAPAPTPAPKVDMPEYAKKRDVSQLRTDTEAKQRELQSSMEAKQRELQHNLTDTLLKVTDALPGVVQGHVAEALKAMTPVTLSVVLPNREPTALGMVHRKTSDIIKMLAAGVNVYLHGPAGSGKTTAGRKCADAFELPFYFAAKVADEFALLGFENATGKVVRTQFREAYEHGGVFLFDELDASSPQAVVALNAALANGICAFPDGIINRHADFKCIAAGNTKLSGASRQYVGRSQLDAASIDRFAFVEFAYDDALETALATNAKWCEYVQAARKAVADRGLPHLITPRATYDGCKLLEAGMDWLDVANSTIWKGLEADTVSQITPNLPKPPKPVSIL